LKFREVSASGLETVSSTLILNFNYVIIILFMVEY
jgi:hypothetical protein